MRWRGRHLFLDGGFGHGERRRQIFAMQVGLVHRRGARAVTATTTAGTGGPSGGYLKPGPDHDDVRQRRDSSIAHAPNAFRIGCERGPHLVGKLENT